MRGVLSFLFFAVAASGQSTVHALEKVAVRLTDLGQPAWQTNGPTCELSYYNTCTGWTWVWDGLQANDRLGVSFEDSNSAVNVVQASQAYLPDAVPPGWGYTGTIAVFHTDEDGCPIGPAVEAKPFSPTDGWNVFEWNATVSTRWAVAVTFGPATQVVQVSFATDHPAAGPTGPPACGTCFPTDRVARSFWYTVDGVYPCPQRFYDGVCDAELLWGCQYTGCEPVAMEDTSWSQIKSLYR